MSLAIGLDETELARSIERKADATRASIVGVYIKACLALGPGYALFFALFDAWWSFPAPVVFTMATLVALVAYRGGHWRAAGTIVVAGLWLTPAWVMVTTGALYSPVLIWLTPTPFMAGTMLGRRAAVIVGATSVAFAAALGLLPLEGAVPHDFAAAFPRQLLGIACGTTAVGLLTFFGWSATSSFERGQAKLAREHAEAVAVSKALDERTRDMRAVLDNVEQGLMVVDLDGRMGREVSRSVMEWFGDPEAAGAETLWAFAEPHDPDTAAMLELGWSDLRDGIMPAELILAQLPARYAADGRTWSLEYRGIGESDEPSAVLVVMSDITEALEAERNSRLAADTLALFERFLSDRAAMRRTIKEIDLLIRRVEQPPQGRSHAEIMRDLHTIKGNCGIIGVGQVASLAHEIEDAVAASGEFDATMARPLAEVWRKLHDRVGHWLAERNLTEVRNEDIEALLRLVDEGRPAVEVRAAVRRWSLESSVTRLTPLALEATRAAVKLGKPRPDVQISGGQIHLPPDALAELCTSMVHVVRNAVDHGIEDPATREAAGKPAAGRIRLATARSRDGRLVVSVEDDGRGIDWARLGEKLAAAGLPCETREALVEGLFSDGVSTAETVTDVSGRGVGLAALRANLEAAGGELEVLSDPGIGTTFQFTIPWPAGAQYVPATAAVVDPRVAA